MKRVIAGLSMALALLLLAIVVLNMRDEADLTATDDQQVSDHALHAAQIQRGAYLARAGNCQSCHTQPGGAPYAGGKGIVTPFGVVYPGNLTPDPDTGLGRWNAAHFWRAMHNGRSKDGRYLYPAFPYQQYSLITRDDADALFSYLRSLPAVQQRNREHALSFPYNTQAALVIWRALYFKPRRDEPVADQSAQWHRGRYLVEGLGHCAACHSPRNALGAIVAGREFSGGMLGSDRWYAPSMHAMAEAGVMDWSTADVVQLLKAGRTRSAHVSGPMASVVSGSTQYLTDADLAAMAIYLKSFSRSDPAPVRVDAAEPSVMQRGARLYDKHCAECHGDQGEGREGAYPALRGNRAVTLSNTTNLIHVIREGGFGPTTALNPRPYGMPPFGHLLSHREMAELITFIRQSWGNQASPVSELDSLRTH